ncbi:MAG TPA: primosomal replication protein N [Burkholderiales bacterium]|nr:primosomal replication protein N [Burkholderiales bacterium]
MDSNRVVLGGRVAGMGELRHTPAGTPIVEFAVNHVSRQVEAGIARSVECELAAVAVGEMARKAALLAAGTTVRVEGFLASRSRGSRQPVLHVNNFETLG